MNRDEPEVNQSRTKMNLARTKGEPEVSQLWPINQSMWTEMNQRRANGEPKCTIGEPELGQD